MEVDLSVRRKTLSWRSCVMLSMKKSNRKHVKQRWTKSQLSS